MTIRLDERISIDDLRTIEEFIEMAHAIAVDRGWWPEDKLARLRQGNPETLVSTLALITTEVSEAVEDVRQDYLGFSPQTQGLTGTVLTHPSGLPIELADIVLRVFDLASALDIDLARMIRVKMQWNAKRSHRHGGKTI